EEVAAEPQRAADRPDGPELLGRETQVHGALLLGTARAGRGSRLRRDGGGGQLGVRRGRRRGGRQTARPGGVGGGRGGGVGAARGSWRQAAGVEEGAGLVFGGEGARAVAVNVLHRRRPGGGLGVDLLRSRRVGVRKNAWVRSTYRPRPEIARQIRHILIKPDADYGRALAAAGG